MTVGTSTTSFHFSAQRRNDTGPYHRFPTYSRSNVPFFSPKEERHWHIQSFYYIFQGYRSIFRAKRGTTPDISDVFIRFSGVSFPENVNSSHDTCYKSGTTGVVPCLLYGAISQKTTGNRHTEKEHFGNMVKNI